MEGYAGGGTTCKKRTYCDRCAIYGSHTTQDHIHRFRCLGSEEATANKVCGAICTVCNAFGASTDATCAAALGPTFHRQVGSAQGASPSVASASCLDKVLQASLARQLCLNLRSDHPLTSKRHAPCRRTYWPVLDCSRGVPPWGRLAICRARCCCTALAQQTRRSTMSHTSHYYFKIICMITDTAAQDPVQV